MRLFHISDLHLGKVLNGYNLINEQKYALQQVINYIDQYNPDVLLIAGDIYDKSVPNNDAFNVFDWFLTTLNIKFNNLKVLIIAGNHDSYSKLNFGSGLFKHNNIYIFANDSINDNKFDVIKVNDEYGNINFYCTPFRKPVMLDSKTYEKIGNNYQAMFDYMINGCNIAKNERNILLAHQFFIKENKNNLIYSDSETSVSLSLTLGGSDCIDISNYIDLFDYMAFGHIHSTQKLNDNAYYSGSLYKYSISEANNNKNIIMVDLKEKGNMTTTYLPLKPLKDIIVIKGNYQDIIDENKDKKIDDYVALVFDNVITDSLYQSKLHAIFINLLEIKYKNNPFDINFNENKDEQVITWSPLQQFNALYKTIYQDDLDQNQQSFLQDLIDKIKNEVDL